MGGAGRRRCRRRSRGATLLELAMYLGIAGIVAGGAMAYYSSASMANRTRESSERVLRIVSIVREMFADQEGYQDLTPGFLATLPQIPRSWVKNGNVVTPLGGRIDIEQSGSTSVFMIVVQDLTANSCTRMLLMPMGEMRLWVNGQYISSVPVTPDQAPELCNRTRNWIHWDYS